MPQRQPVNEQVLWPTPACDATDVTEALTHARAALKNWPAVTGWQCAQVEENEHITSLPGERFWATF